MNHERKQVDDDWFDELICYVVVPVIMIGSIILVFGMAVLFGLIQVFDGLIQFLFIFVVLIWTVKTESRLQLLILFVSAVVIWSAVQSND